MRVALFLLTALCLCACARGTAPLDNSGMEINVHLRDMHRCSRISPEIEVTGYPADTTMFEVALEETGKQPRRVNHGGGSWHNDGTGIIPEGALLNYYRGACPPNGQVRTYQYVVTAYGVNKKPLAKARYAFKQE